MKNALWILSFAIASILALPVAAQAELSADDDCKIVVEELAKGVARGYQQFDKKISASVRNIRAESVTEVRDYLFEIQSESCVDTYQLELDNDSASKCTINQLSAREICG